MSADHGFSHGLSLQQPSIRDILTVCIIIIMLCFHWSGYDLLQAAAAAGNTKAKAEVAYGYLVGAVLSNGCVYVCTYMYVYIYMYMYVHVYMCVRTYNYMYIHVYDKARLIF